MIDILSLKRQLLPVRGLRKKDGPDYSGINAAAQANAEIAKEALDWYKSEYAKTQDQRDATQERSNAVSDAQLASMEQQNEITKDYWDYQKGTYRPLEESLVADASSYDTENRRDSEADAAVADVQQRIAAQRGATMRDMARSGVNPDSGKIMAMSGVMDIEGAKAAAGADYGARKAVETQGWARKMDAASLGRNLASSQATSAQIATQTGNSAVANSGAANQAATSGAGLMGSGFNTAISGNNSAGNLYGQVAKMQTSEDDGLMSGVGGIMSGLGAMGATLPFSDETMKENIKPVSDDKALQQVSEVDAQKTWRYKDETGLPTDEKTGPMAQDVNRVMGDKAAPGGKVIDLVTLNGKNMAAIRALNKKVDQVATKVDRIAAVRGVMA